MHPTPPSRSFWRRRRVRVAAAGLALVAAGALTTSVVLPATASPDRPAQRATTCSRTCSSGTGPRSRRMHDQLGPAGYAGVQVAPPQDSLQRTALGNGSDTVLHPWWEVYQPTDYTLTSRMGTCSTWMRLSSSPCVIR